jgi:hypothetical protein
MSEQVTVIMLVSLFAGSMFLGLLVSMELVDAGRSSGCNAIRRVLGSARSRERYSRCWAF